MALKDYIAAVAAGGSLVFGWIASQEQLCDMRLAQPICIERPAASTAPASANVPAAAPPTTNPLPPAAPAASAPTSAPSSAAAPPPAQAPPPVLATGADLSGVPQAVVSPEDAAQFEQQIRGYLDGSARNHAAGFRPSANDSIVAMQPTTSNNVQVMLNSGVRYRVLGACDNDCSAIALEAYDPNGALITRSSGEGDFPVLELTPSSSGQFTVRVRLVTCRVAPCFVGVRVLEQ
jgi:hypothetical protein